jgi:hypothetical protein
MDIAMGEVNDGRPPGEPEAKEVESPTHPMQHDPIGDEPKIKEEPKSPQRRSGSADVLIYLTNDGPSFFDLTASDDEDMDIDKQPQDEVKEEEMEEKELFLVPELSVDAYNNPDTPRDELPRDASVEVILVSCLPISRVEFSD